MHCTEACRTSRGLDALLVTYLSISFSLDTMGYAFTYPAARVFGGCQVAAYVHYPTVSSDMIGRVASRESSHNNASEVASSSLYTTLKLIYYRCFAFLYAAVGSLAHIVMVNSSWTKGHIDSLWKIKSTVIYPPCDTEAFKDFPLRNRERIVVSVAQFRPEKGHSLQLEAMAQLLKNHPEYRQQAGGKNPQAVQLVMVGSARNTSDQAKIKQLKDKAEELGISVCSPANQSCKMIPCPLLLNYNSPCFHRIMLHSW